MSKTLQEIKDEVARDNGYEFGFNEAAGAEDCPKFFVDQVAKRFAFEVAKETLRNASINVSMKMKENAYELDMMDDILEVDRASILNENNIPKL